MTRVQLWIDVLPDSHFSIANIPFGVFKTEQDPVRQNFGQTLIPGLLVFKSAHTFSTGSTML